MFLTIGMQNGSFPGTAGFYHTPPLLKLGMGCNFGERIISFSSVLPLHNYATSNQNMGHNENKLWHVHGGHDSFSSLPNGPMGMKRLVPPVYWLICYLHWLICTSGISREWSTCITQWLHSQMIASVFSVPVYGSVLFDLDVSFPWDPMGWREV